MTHDFRIDPARPGALLSILRTATEKAERLRNQQLIIGDLWDEEVSLEEATRVANLMKGSAREIAIEAREQITEWIDLVDKEKLGL